MLLPHDDVGAGLAVVLLHAGIADRTMWADHLRPIADAGYRVVAKDLPGFGEAPPAQGEAAWSDVVQTMDALNLDRATLVGNSFGGAVALRVAVLAPERAVAIALVSAPPPDLEPSDELKAAWDAEESALERGDIEGAVGAVLDAWMLADVPTALRDRVATMQRSAFEVQAAASRVTEAQDPIETDPGAPGRLAILALVSAGEHDIPDLRFGAEALAQQLRHARHVVIPRAGHLAPLEQPVAFRELLLGFLANPHRSTHTTMWNDVSESARPSTRIDPRDQCDRALLPPLGSGRLGQRLRDACSGRSASVRLHAIGARPAPASVTRQSRRADCPYPCEGAGPRPPPTHGRMGGQRAGVWVTGDSTARLGDPTTSRQRQFGSRCRKRPAGCRKCPFASSALPIFRDAASQLRRSGPGSPGRDPASDWQSGGSRSCRPAVTRYRCASVPFSPVALGALRSRPRLFCARWRLPRSRGSFALTVCLHAASCVVHRVRVA